MLFPWLTPLIAALALLFLAIAVGRRASEGQLPQAFVFFAVVLCFWNLNFFALYSIEDFDLLWEVSRTLRTGTIFLPPAILHLFLSIEPVRRPVWARVLVADYAVAALLALANALDLLVVNLHRVDYGFVSVGSAGYHLFTVFALANAAAALMVLAQDFRTSREPRTRQQLTFWVVGSMLATPLVLTNFVPAYGVPIYPPGNLGSAVWAAIIGYAIVRHRLLDIELVVSRGISYFVVVVVFLLPLGVGLLGLQRYAFGVVDYNATVGLLGLCVLISTSFSYAQAWLERRIESSLLKDKREAREALISFGKSVVRMLDEPRIVRELMQCVEDALQLTNLSLFSASDNDRRYRLRVWRGLSPNTDVLDDPGLLQWAHGLTVPVLKSEIMTSELPPPVRDAVVSLFAANGWELVIPMGAGGTALGILCLGPKPFAQTYSAGDIAVLESLGAQASIAVENARLHERLKLSREMVHRSDRLSALGTLAAGIAHEIRNPLVSIHTFFQLAPKRLNDAEFMTSFLGLAEREVVRIRNLIGDLLSYAKASAPEMVEIHLADVVERVTTLLEPHANERRVELRVQLVNELPTVEADRDQLIQALLNIVLNAIDATDPGGSVELSGSRQVREDSEYSCLTIVDTGRGIPAASLEAIFDPFFTTKDAGTGLGLAISHRIIDDLGGFVTVSSELGEGSRFTVGLPTVDSTRSESRSVAASGGRY